MQEIENTGNNLLRKKLKAAVIDYPIDIVSNINEVELQRMAFTYISEGVIPAKKVTGCPSYSCMYRYVYKFLVSWNYKHLANINKERRILAVNLENNYINPLRIITPIELINHEN